MKNTKGTKLNNTKKLLSVGVIVLMAGCSSTPHVSPVANTVAAEQMSRSRAAINTANGVGANEFAPVALQAANDKMAAAERAMGANNPSLAKQLSEQAQVDAELATASSNAVKAQKGSDALQESNRVLRSEINRNSDR